MIRYRRSTLLQHLGSPLFRAFLAVVVLPPGKAFSQDIEYRGTLSSRVAVETRDGNMQLGEVKFEPELAGTLTPNISFRILGRLRGDTQDQIEPGDPGAQSAARSDWNRRAFIVDNLDAELREAYADIYAGDWFFRLGKQQVVWGQADGLRVLDQVNPLSFREFTLGNFEDRRIPLWMANLERSFRSVTVQFLWIPDHTYNEVPSTGTFRPTSPLLVPSPPTDFSGPIQAVQGNRPNRLITDDDYGIRLTGFSHGWDWSLNGLYSYSDAPVISQQLADDGTLFIAPRYERSLLIGGSASNAFGKFTLRAELGYATNRYVLINDPTDEDGVAKSSELSSVIGLDYQVNADTLFSSQLFMSVLPDNPNGAIRDQATGTLTILARRELRNDTIRVEGLLIQDLNQGDGVLQVSANYELTSSVTLSAGVDVFYGTTNGIYGQFDQTDRITLGFEYGF